MNKRTINVNSDSDIDWSSWLIEKSNNVSFSIANAIDELKRIQSISDDEKSELMDYLLYASRDSLKILAFSLGVESSLEDNNLLLKEGHEGYEKIQVKYGLKNKTNKDIERERREKLYFSLITYISGNKEPNKHYVDELLAKYNDKIQIIQNIKERAEEVTFHITTWENFCDFILKNESKLKDWINDV